MTSTTQGEHAQPEALAHELFATAQLAPGEGIEDAVGRIAALVEAQQPAAHVQNPAEIEHVAGDVSQNGPESNMTRAQVDAIVYACRQAGDDSTYAVVNAALVEAQQPAPSAAAAVGQWSVLNATGWPVSENISHDVARSMLTGERVELGWRAVPSPTPQADSAPAEAVQRIVHLRADRERRVYVAGPMTGLPEYNFPLFNATAARLRSEGWYVENPAEHGHVDGAGWSDYLRWDISRIATCGAIYLLPGWPKSKGATLEVHIAGVLGLQVLLADGAEAPQADSQPAPIMPKGESAAPGLRAMATGYPAGHLWDKLDAKTCIRGALEIEALRAARAPADSVTAPAGAEIERLRAQVESLTRDCGRQASKIVELGSDLKFQEEKHREDRARLQALYEHQRGECWYWQGDGHDHLESLCNTLPVVIRADQLRALVSNPPAQAADSVLKDNQIAALVNELRDIVIQYHGTQQLRERIAHAVVPALKAQAADSVLEDAARYQWLRNPTTDVALVLDKRTGYVPVDEQVPSVGGYYTYEYRSGAELDAAIDAARKQGANHD